jgi:hypothetical protein
MAGGKCIKINSESVGTRISISKSKSPPGYTYIQVAAAVMLSPEDFKERPSAAV